MISLWLIYVITVYGDMWIYAGYGLAESETVCVSLKHQLGVCTTRKGSLKPFLPFFYF